MKMFNYLFLSIQILFCKDVIFNIYVMSWFIVFKCNIFFFIICIKPITNSGIKFTTIFSMLNSPTMCLCNLFKNWN